MIFGFNINTQLCNFANNYFPQNVSHPALPFLFLSDIWNILIDPKKTENGCGLMNSSISNEPSSSVVNADRQWPWHVCIVVFTKCECGGTLVAPGYIVTSNLCVTRVLLRDIKVLVIQMVIEILDVVVQSCRSTLFIWGMVWYGIVLVLVWCGIWYGVVRYGVVRYGVDNVVNFYILLSYGDGIMW